MSSNPRFETRPTAVAALVLVLAALGAGPLAAQSVQGDPTDLDFAIVNATTGEPTPVSRMTIAYLRNRPLEILDFEPKGAEFVAPGVPIKDVGQYIITVWKDDVPYWWSKRGRELTAGPVTLHVFDTTRSTDGVRITGLNVVLRHQESLLAVEMMLQVENTGAPQQTVFDDHGTFRVAFPRDAAQIEATYRRGPEPTPIDTRLTGDRLSLAVPLTPGGNQIQIKASVPWREGLIVPVGASLDIAEWSLLTAPEGLEVEALELEAGATDVPGFARFTGPSLNADRNFELRLQFKAGPAPTTEDVFTRGTPAADAGADRKGEGGGVGVLPFVFGGVLIIIVIAAAARRRG